MFDTYALFLRSRRIINANFLLIIIVHVEPGIWQVAMNYSNAISRQRAVQ